MRPHRLSLFALLFMAWVLPAAAADTRLDTLVFENLADDLAKGLADKRSTIQGMLEWAGWSDAKRVRMAVLPFAPGEAAPVPDRDAQRFNDVLSDALARRSDLGVDLVAREELRRVMKDMANFDQDGWKRLLKGANAEIRVVGTATPLEDGVELSYRAITSDGRTAATTRPRKLAFDWRGAAILSLDEALEKAATALAQDASDIRRLAPAGIVVQPGGGHTALGRYLEETLIERLNRKVKFQRTNGVSVPLSRLEEAGLNLARQPVESLAADQAGSYVLSGEIFPMARSIDVFFRLRGSQGDASYRTRIARAGIDPRLLPPPAGGDNPFADDNLGPNHLTLSSDHGGNPVYHIGDTVNLVIQSGEGGHLYCFVQQSRGGIVRIFPNRHHAGTRIDGRRQLLIPGPTMPFDWTIEPPAGEDLVKCFVLDRDVWAELPKSITAQDFEPMPGIKSLDNLRAIFRALRRVALSEATLRVTVAERR